MARRRTHAVLVGQWRDDGGGEVLGQVLAEEGEVLEPAPRGRFLGRKVLQVGLRAGGELLRPVAVPGGHDALTLADTRYETKVSLVPSSSVFASLTCTCETDVASASGGWAVDDELDG